MEAASFKASLYGLWSADNDVCLAKLITLTTTATYTCPTTFWCDDGAKAMGNTNDNQKPSRQLYAEVALLAAAVEAYNAEQHVEQAEFYASAARGRPRVHQGDKYTVDFQYHGESYRLKISRPGPQHYQVNVDGQSIEVRTEQSGALERYITYYEQRYRISSFIDGLNYYVDVEGTGHRMIHKEGGIIRAPAPAIVVSVAVKPGDQVEVGSRLATIEFMKMEMAITAPFLGRVVRLFVTNNVQVDRGTPLIQIEPVAWNDKPLDAQRVRFDHLPATTPYSEEDFQEHCHSIFAALRCQILGYDRDKSDASRLLDEQNAIYNLIAPGDQELLRSENEILSIFADICLLFRRELDLAEAEGEQVHSAEQDLLSYLRSRDTRAEQLPHTFLTHLQRTLAHYGVKSLDPTPELDESLLLIYKSHQRVDLQLAAITAILERHLAHIGSCISFATEEMQSRLDHLLTATQRHYPTINDLIREVRFRYFDKPLFEQARRKVYEEVLAHLAYLEATPAASDHDE